MKKILDIFTQFPKDSLSFWKEKTYSAALYTFTIVILYWIVF